MKRWISFAALSALTYCSPIRLQASGSISLERLVGHYGVEHRGDASGGDVTISINPDRTLCVNQRHGLSVGLLRDGAVVLKNDGVPRTGPDRTNLPPSILFYPVCWGERTYLIKESEMLEFCNRIDAGIEPKDGTGGIYFSGFCLKDGDRKKDVTGDPDIPEHYRKFLLPMPVSGKVVEIVADNQAWIDLGSDAGLQPDMTLMLHIPPERLLGRRGRFDLVIRVKDVQKDRSLIEGSHKLSKVGDAVTSRR